MKNISVLFCYEYTTHRQVRLVILFARVVIKVNIKSRYETVINNVTINEVANIGALTLVASKRKSTKISF